MKMLIASLLVCALMALTRAAEAGPAGKKDTPVQKGVSRSLKARMSCPSGWTLINGRCFLYVATTMTWANAEKNCQFLGGNLASIHTSDEYQLIQSLILRVTHGFPYTWVGGSDAEQEGTWLWSDGTGFRFTHWSQGQPDGSGNCQLMNYGGDMKLDDQPCSYSMPSICSKRE